MGLKPGVEVAPYDYADYIKTPEDARIHLEYWEADGDASLVNQAEQTVARATLRSLDDILAELEPDCRARIEARAAQLIAEIRQPLSEELVEFRRQQRRSRHADE